MNDRKLLPVGEGVLRSVSVIGDGSVPPGSELYEVAFQVGKLIAEKGFVLICGGMFGVMEGACKGAKAVGGFTVGILPHYEFQSNPYVDLKIPTGLAHGRNVIVAASSNLVVAVGGSYGTLSEIAFALKLGRRVVGYRTWSVDGIDNYEEVGDFINSVNLALELL
jgi:uncharacterized protein (TIGR00725 family)